MSTEIILTSTADTYICKHHNMCNWGHSPSLFVGKRSNNCCLFRSLIKFDICSLPKNVLVSKAILKLFLYKKYHHGTQKITIYPFKNSFNEFSVNWNTKLKVQHHSINKYIMDTQINTYIEIDITTFIISWYKNIFPNYGIELLGTKNTPSLIKFRSREFSNSSQRPKLSITYNNIKSHITNLPDVMASESGTSSTYVKTNFQPGITFYIHNNDKYLIVSQLQISNDGLLWINEGPSLIIDGRCSSTLTTYAITKKIHVILKGVGIREATSLNACLVNCHHL